MSSNTPSSNFWSIMRWLALAIFPALASQLPVVQSLTHDRLVAIMLLVVYEIALFFVYIFTKVWQQVEESWVKDIAHAVDQLVRDFLSGYSRHYRDYFYYEHRDLDVKGLSTQGIYTLDLEDIFVELTIDPTAPHKASADPLRLPVELLTGSHTIWEYFQAKPLRKEHFVLLGAPGSGKTTLLKHLGLALLHRRRSRHLKALPHMLPLLLFLRDHSAAIQGIPGYSLAEAVRASMEKWKHPMPVGWIERHLDKERCLVLLDGLDEVADAALRQQIAAWVERQMIIYGKNRFVVTSRPFGYRSNPLSKVTVLEVQPFIFNQITQFVHNWYLANETKSAVRDDPGVRMRAEERARDLLRRLREAPALFQLAVNPLLLTMIATVHRYRGSLPGARITLYKEICEVFLGKRQEARGIRYELRADQRQLVLQPLAYHMMQQNERDISSAEAEKVIAEALQRVSTQMASRMFLQSIENTSGLLLEREQGNYAFAHLTFQEYLAAAHIRENALEQTLIKQVASSWWRETILLYCAQADASAIIAACLAGTLPSIALLTLASECLDEARNVQANIKHQFNIVIKQGVEDADPERRSLVAEVLLARRLRHMRPVNERVFIDTSLVEHAEYQLFLDDQRTQGKSYRPDHWKDISFPPGTGRKPVLGIRRSDALAFCAWLTVREKGIWQYRLPRPEEYKQEDEHMWNEPGEELGYWVEGEQTFIWSKGKPSLFLQEQFHDAVISALEHVCAVASIHARTLGLDLDYIRTRVRDLAGINSNAIDLDLYCSRDFAFSGGIRARIDARALDLASFLDTDINVRAVAELRDIYITLFLAQKRIEGSFPVYEGIRLAKEQR